MWSHTLDLLHFSMNWSRETLRRSPQLPLCRDVTIYSAMQIHRYWNCNRNVIKSIYKIGCNNVVVCSVPLSWGYRVRWQRRLYRWHTAGSCRVVCLGRRHRPGRGTERLGHSLENNNHFRVRLLSDSQLFNHSCAAAYSKDFKIIGLGGRPLQLVKSYAI